MLSESQERMLLVAEKGREAEVAGFQKVGAGRREVGQVTKRAACGFKSTEQMVAEISERRAHRRRANLQAASGALGAAG